MSTMKSLVIIKGNYLQKISNILQLLGFEVLEETYEANNWDMVDNLYDKFYNHHKKEKEAKNSDKTFKWVYSWLQNGWTVIDLDIIMYAVMNHNELIEMSSLYNTEIFNIIIEEDSISYGFALFKNNEKIREFICSDGDIVRNIGEPLPQEKRFQINENIHMADIVGLTKKICIDYNKIDNLNQ